ncbi:hypothetical protein RRG08_040196 [Elysia crispata]|uniref:Uncharacterized protein n=1 Tax=Elysia crispata TaxID=231223 RepID=A0AAE0XX22_9GAST|nr:hypothetical protein RRG08_040196 [Elysia crispata]
MSSCSLQGFSLSEEVDESCCIKITGCHHPLPAHTPFLSFRVWIFCWRTFLATTSPLKILIFPANPTTHYRNLISSATSILDISVFTQLKKFSETSTNFIFSSAKLNQLEAFYGLCCGIVYNLTRI